jgi:hypothetical protein
VLNLEGINWGNWKFGSSQKPIPVISRESQAYKQAAAEIGTLESRPILRDELAGFLYRLQGHYWAAGMPERVAQSVADDYLRLLSPGNYWLLAVQNACDKWVRNPEAKFFPKLGELEELIKTEQNKIKWRLVRLKGLVGAAA